ncbi:MAG: Flp family type IVb pilin [Acidimicrobiales bacterium]
MKKRVLLWRAQLAGWLQYNFSPRGDVGASLVEYVLLITLIAVAAIGALVALSGSINGTLNKVTNDISNSITTTTAG